ncbi:unnamed protein product [Rhizophagus irregularis]|nr:unnamed protein product [Rhizophagus irregularis]
MEGVVEQRRKAIEDKFDKESGEDGEDEEDEEDKEDELNRRVEKKLGRRVEAEIRRRIKEEQSRREMERLSVEDNSNRIKEAEDESIRGVDIEQQKDARPKKNNRGGKGKSRAKVRR